MPYIPKCFCGHILSWHKKGQGECFRDKCECSSYEKEEPNA